MIWTVCPAAVCPCMPNAKCLKDSCKRNDFSHPALGQWHGGKWRKKVNKHHFKVGFLSFFSRGVVIHRFEQVAFLTVAIA